MYGGLNVELEYSENDFSHISHLWILTLYAHNVYLTLLSSFLKEFSKQVTVPQLVLFTFNSNLI